MFCIVFIPCVKYAGDEDGTAGAHDRSPRLYGFIVFFDAGGGLF
jgi:hypothetical protein